MHKNLLVNIPCSRHNQYTKRFEKWHWIVLFFFIFFIYKDTCVPKKNIWGNGRPIHKLQTKPCHAKLCVNHYWQRSWNNIHETISKAAQPHTHLISQHFFLRGMLKSLFVCTTSPIPISVGLCMWFNLLFRIYLEWCAHCFLNLAIREACTYSLEICFTFHKS